MALTSVATLLTTSIAMLAALDAASIRAAAWPLLLLLELASSKTADTPSLLAVLSDGCGVDADED
jgi:hypothetical protein